MASSSRMRNSELAKKLKARVQKTDEQASLLPKGKRSSSDTTNDSSNKPKTCNISPKTDEENDPYARFPFLAPFMVCQALDEVATPSSTNCLPARHHLGRKDYPVLNQSEAQVEQQGELRNTMLENKPSRSGNTLVNSNSSPSLSSHPTPKRGHKQLQTPADQTHNFDMEQKTSSPSSTAGSSLNTCAPSSLLITGSTSATNNSPGNASDTSSLVVCAPQPIMVAASTSATCPSVPPQPKSSPRSDNKNLLRLFYDMDDKKNSRKNRGRANSSPKRPQGWKLSPFQKSRKSKKVAGDVEKKEKLAIPIPYRQHQQPRGAPVDIDEVSVDSYDDVDTEAGYYSDPTDADLRSRTHLYRERYTHNTLGTDQSIPANRKSLDSERVLSQLGMDVHEDDYCIEGEYSMSRHHHASHNDFRRAGNGRWNYHQRNPSYGYDSSLDARNMTAAANARKDKPQIYAGRRRGSKLSENIRESMKKFGSIVKLSDDEKSQKDRGAREQHINDNLGSKVLSMLRGHYKGSSIPQSITITPTASEDPELNMTNDDLELVQRWQKVRARRREGQGSPDIDRGYVIPNVSQHTDTSAHKRNESEVLSIANSVVSDRTAHVENRQTREKPGHRTDSSF